MIAGSNPNIMNAQIYLQLETLQMILLKYILFKFTQCSFYAIGIISCSAFFTRTGCYNERSLNLRWSFDNSIDSCKLNTEVRLSTIYLSNQSEIIHLKYKNMKEFLPWFWSTYLVVSVFAFYSDDPNSNLIEMYSFYSLKLLHKNENKLKRDRAWPN